MTTHAFLETAKDVFRVESDAVANLASRIDQNFVDSVSAILESSGRCIICGMGKSGIIGKKMAATLASTGTPSFFMHPGEAYHGDLGMVTPDDVFVAISNSGETSEVVKLIPFLKDNGNYLVSLTGNPESTLAKASNSHLDISVEEEACPLQLAPTASTTATLAMGDALAVTLMKARDFKPENFARFHPGGSLGRRLLSTVNDEMVAERLPLVAPEASVLDLIESIGVGGLGIAIVQSSAGLGIVTDGDIRRAVQKYGDNLFQVTANDVMTPDPACIASGARIEDALYLMDKQRITSLLVTDKGQVIGVFKK
ncbi:carbohydrate isomerase KpsF/GutQ family protein [Alcanivorax sp. MD8A]|uniref:KpsF/GutQ family sugar-phosphate isomerase n=1 Tax=Alcanivorax sp. MD8A TaxID=1177157 RepID=UPI000C9BCA6A|nr:KpsF/GutQ family sugar-phosphate isomerase [Alcanivorax sp. MD8A]PNE02521.1 carbohydrate isomerase KpsF/GutQ family protein [Alcanivorax sp. MD8A]